MRRIDYNRLGADGFRELCHAILLRVIGPTYRPFSAGGADAQRDGTFEGRPLKQGLPAGYWVAQFKHHDVENVGASVARARFLREVRTEVEGWRVRSRRGERIPDVLLFVTNVLGTGPRSSGMFDRFNALAKSFGRLKPRARALVWEKARLDQEIDCLEDVQRAWLPPTIEDILVHLGVPQGAMATLVQDRRVVDVDFTASAQYSSDWDAIVVVAELGNETGRKLTIKDVVLSIDEVGVLAPNEPDASKQVTGASWGGPDVYGPIPSDQFARLAWLFRVNRMRVREMLECHQPLRGTLVVHCFPRRTLAQEVLVYSIQKLREIAEAGQETPPTPRR